MFKDLGKYGAWLMFIRLMTFSRRNKDKSLIYVNKAYSTLQSEFWVAVFFFVFLSLYKNILGSKM